MSVKIESLAIPDLKLFTAPRYSDERGTFSETWNQRDLAAAGFCCDFVQDNHAISFEEGTMRGLHFQSAPHAQGKLIRVVRGRIFDVAVDLRSDSATFGQWVATELAAQTGEQLWVPAGFAHGYYTLEPLTEVVYKVDEYYDPAAEGGICWDDPELNIDWPNRNTVTAISPKDRMLPTFSDWRRKAAAGVDRGGSLYYDERIVPRHRQLRSESVST
jgi:dTDP-4-dehydrorhamnose 3,5-epimerase